MALPACCWSCAGLCDIVTRGIEAGLSTIGCRRGLCAGQVCVDTGCQMTANGMMAGGLRLTCEMQGGMHMMQSLRCS
jgi:hypothetical protein